MSVPQEPARPPEFHEIPRSMDLRTPSLVLAYITLGFAEHCESRSANPLIVSTLCQLAPPFVDRIIRALSIHGPSGLSRITLATALFGFNQSPSLAVP